MFMVTLVTRWAQTRVLMFCMNICSSARDLVCWAGPENTDGFRFWLECCVFSSTIPQTLYKFSLISLWLFNHQNLISPSNIGFGFPETWCIRTERSCRSSSWTTVCTTCWMCYYTHSHISSRYQKWNLLAGGWMDDGGGLEDEWWPACSHSDCPVVTAL